jgi:CBS domain-containing protein
MTLDTIMSTDLITITPEQNLAAARELMHDRKIHHLPVVNDDQELVGLVTLTNVLAATDSFLRADDSRIHAAEIVVKDIMVTDVATVDAHASLRQAALFLEQHRIGCLPVMSDGNLKGIITDTDFVGVAINLLEQIEETEPFDDEVDELDELDEVV